MSVKHARKTAKFDTSRKRVNDLPVDDKSEKPPNICDNHTVAAKFLAEKLEFLMSLPLDTLEDVNRWDIECEKVETDIDTHFPNFEFEHFVWHFFTDSDIRQKDFGYRQSQHKQITDYIARLRGRH
jgi:hypothetical protein